MEKILEKYKKDFEFYSVEQLQNLRKWLVEYMVPLDEKKLNEQIVWLNLTGEQLFQFLMKNYVDNNKQVMWHVNYLPTALGMRYISFLHATGFNYLIGVITNNVGKQTIVASLCYQNDKICSISQEKTVNYIQNIEVNSFYQGAGLFKILASKIKDVMDFNKDFVITDEEDDGIEFHTIERITKILREQGYNGGVFSRSEFKEKCRKNK